MTPSCSACTPAPFIVPRTIKMLIQGHLKLLRNLRTSIHGCLETEEPNWPQFFSLLTLLSLAQKETAGHWLHVMCSLQVHQFSGLGGSAVGLTTWRFLHLLLTQEVVVNYSWFSQKGKRIFSALNVADVETLLGMARNDRQLSQSICA